MLVWLAPVLSAVVAWLWGQQRANRVKALAEGREEGRAEQLEAARAKATEALHARLDSHKERLERLERKTQKLREALIAAELVIPDDTQPGVPNPLRRR